MGLSINYLRFTFKSTVQPEEPRRNLNSLQEKMLSCIFVFQQDNSRQSDEACRPHGIRSTPSDGACRPHGIRSTPSDGACRPHRIRSTPSDEACRLHGIRSTPSDGACHPHGIRSTPSDEPQLRTRNDTPVACSRIEIGVWPLYPVACSRMGNSFSRL